MKEAFIKVENLSFSYDDDAVHIPAVSNLSIDIEEGSYVAVIGRNGSGKSTFAKLLNMILEPTEGKLKARNGDLTFGRLKYHI